MTDVHSATRTSSAETEPEPDESKRLAALADYRLIPLVKLDAVRMSEQIVGDLQGLAEVATRLTGSQAAVFNIISKTHQHQIAAWNISPTVCERKDSMCAVAFLEGGTVVVPDASQDPRYASNPFVTGSLGNVRFYASAPLIVPGGHILGTLCVFDNKIHEMSEEQEEGLRLLADQAVEVLELSRQTRLLDEAVERLTTTNELLTGFAGRVSHDLKAPIGVIQAFAETLADAPAIASDPTAAHQVSRIEASCRRMARMIEDLLKFSAAGGQVHVQPVDVRTMVSEVRQDLEKQIADVGAMVELSAPEGFSVPADPTQLRMFLQNVVANAVKYRRPDLPARIVIDAGRSAHDWYLSVADNGLGIPTEARDSVRQPLVRLDRDKGRGTEGTGIGLATCERIATSHGGGLEISDTPGGGTTVTLRAPNRRSEPADTRTR